MLCLLLLPVAMSGQKVAVKTNILYDALLTPTLGVEAAMAPKWTFELNASLNAWAVDGHRWKQWMAQPEVRYWFCQRFLDILWVRILSAASIISAISTCRLNFSAQTFRF